MKTGKKFKVKWKAAVTVHDVLRDTTMTLKAKNEKDFNKALEEIHKMAKKNKWEQPEDYQIKIEELD